MSAHARPHALTREELHADAAHAQVESEIVARQRAMLVSHATLTKQMAELAIGQQTIGQRVSGLEASVAKIETNFGALTIELNTNTSVTHSISEDTRGIIEAMKTLEGGMRFFSWIGEKRLALLGGAALIVGGWEVVQSWLDRP